MGCGQNGCMSKLMTLGLLVGLLGLISVVLAWVGIFWQETKLVSAFWTQHAAAFFGLGLWLMAVGKVLSCHKREGGSCGGGEKQGCCGEGQK